MPTAANPGGAWCRSKHVPWHDHHTCTSNCPFHAVPQHLINNHSHAVAQRLLNKVLLIPGHCPGGRAEKAAQQR